MTTRRNVYVAVAILLAVSTANGVTIFVDTANCRPPASDCCVANGTPGCDDPACEAAVCAIDPFCCSAVWDDICAIDAVTLCAVLCLFGSGTAEDPYCSIQTAIDNAVDTDEIVVAPGTYFENIDFLGKAITLRSSDGPEVTTIDGTGNFHVVQCVSGEGPATVLDGFAITGGNANGACCGPDSRGGGMYNENSSPTVTDCTFSGNSAMNFGGGMFNDTSSPTVTNCTFSGNATAFGGGMSNNNSSPTVTNCTFSDNSAGFGGGGMSNSSSSPTVANSMFSGNNADLGGGMYNSDGGPTVTNCTFESNTAFGGGGMSNSSSSPTVTDCTFSGNTADFMGGGMGNFSSSSPTVTNCTFSANSSDNGGGMGNVFSSPTVTNGTFSGNTAINGHALAFDSANQKSPSDLLMTNCILWDGGDEIFNNDRSTLNITYTDVQGGFPGTGNIDADPLFVDTLNGNYRLSPGSPCIDAANNIAVPAGITTDLDGNPRFVDDLGTIDTGNGDPPIVDMGAYELQGTSCPWDCGGDDNGNVGIVDFLALLAQWGSPGSCDFDGGGVSITDFLELLAHYGPCP